MQIQLRVRTNDIDLEPSKNQIVHDGFILFDNCTEVKYGKSQIVSKDQFASVTGQYKSLKEFKRSVINNIHPETNTPFSDVIFMVRSVIATEDRINNDSNFRGLTRVDEPLTTAQKNLENYYLTPYHYNVVEWKDRITGNRYRIVFDTVIFLMDDNGNTLRKIEG